MPKMKPPSISIRSQQCPVVGRAADLGGAAILRPWLCSEVLVVAHAERSKSQWCYIIQTESVVQCSAGFTPLVSWLIATTEVYTAGLSINDNPKQNHLRISVNQMIHHFTPMHGGMINLRRSAVVWCNRARQRRVFHGTGTAHPLAALSFPDHNGANRESTSPLFGHLGPTMTRKMCH